MLSALERHGPIEAWIIDDTCFAKKGQHSAGVARQYCGQLGKQDNCQVGVTLSIANHGASLPISCRLYHPQDWAADAARRRKAGVPPEVAGQELGVRPNTVGMWRKRFAARGVAGLRDQVQPGKAAKYGAAFRLRVLRHLELPPPKGLASWDGGSLAEADAVWRVLRKEGIQLSRRRSWCVSTDLQFAAKAADIIGLYLNPPKNALVLSVDEKPTIQALERARGYVQTSNGKVVQGMSTYKRHGTINLFAALEVATGVIRGKTTKTKKRVDFQAFMDELVAEHADREIHVVLDNLCTHKKNEAWLAAHSNVTFHFTPTAASWRNQVEIWFGIFSRKAPAGARFRNIDQLIQALKDFTEIYNKHAAPSVWRKREVKAAQLRNTIVNLCN